LWIGKSSKDVDARAHEKRSHREIRGAVHRLYQAFPGEHRRKLDCLQTNLAGSADKSTHQGDLALSIPEEFVAYRPAPLAIDLVCRRSGSRSSRPTGSI
jgi:hypothetical protein